ncbi:hypothetical protein CMV_023105 [Castanea mollissima]|uniref:Uncharacterized protein n=1 Tax=Castanea mollissima TaxID=60419 RepID=A0A8J4VAZ2_9ROSI|nr:hypothetical protein CMV_023105 [Castanea mollissima]
MNQAADPLRRPTPQTHLEVSALTLPSQTHDKSSSSLQLILAFSSIDFFKKFNVIVLCSRILLKNECKETELPYVGQLVVRSFVMDFRWFHPLSRMDNCIFK